jgi:hypothetical protein
MITHRSKKIFAQTDEISNACSWKFFKPIFNFTLQRQGKHYDIDIIIFNLIKIKKIFKSLDVLFSSDIHILSIKPRKIIDIIAGRSWRIGGKSRAYICLGFW